MSNLGSIFKGWYLAVFHFLTDERVQKNDLNLYSLHAFISSAISMSFLCWAHLILVYFTLDSELTFYVGFVCCLIHTLSPLLLRYTSKIAIISGLMFTSGITFSVTFTYFSGGFMSDNLVWLASAPLLAGSITGGRSAIRWMFFSFSIAFTFFLLNFLGYPFPQKFSPTGLLIMRGFLMAGGITMGTLLSLYFNHKRTNSELLLKDQSRKIDDLFRVLFHDLANSIGRIGIGLTLIKRQETDPKTERGIQIASEANESILEITQNVRKIYAATKGKVDVDLTNFSLCESVEYVRKIFASDLEKKNLRIDFDADLYKDLQVVVEPVSFKNQVLANILSNCIKFSPENGTITIEAFRQDAYFLVIQIRDEGVGMPPHILNNLFDLNKKTSRPGTHGEPGTGFGMHIMKSFMEIYFGNVTIESTESVGTTFKLHLRGRWDGRSGSIPRAGTSHLKTSDPSVSSRAYPVDSPRSTSPR